MEGRKCRDLSCFVAFCRDVASFFCAHKCDMSDPKQDINGVSTSIPVGFDHRWTQVDADIKAGIGYRIADTGLGYGDTKDYPKGSSTGCVVARAEPGKFHPGTTARWRNEIQMSKIGQGICS